MQNYENYSAEQILRHKSGERQHIFALAYLVLSRNLIPQKAFQFSFGNTTGKFGILSIIGEITSILAQPTLNFHWVQIEKSSKLFVM